MTLAAVALTCLLGAVSNPAMDDRPLAYVLDHEDRWSHSAHAAELLERGGFRVEPLPTDRSPLDAPIADMIFLASFSTEDPRYAAYMERYSAALYHYVDKGHLLVQMAQADQTEAVPPFLPSTHGARRCDADTGSAVVTSRGHPLMKGVASGTLSFHATRTIWEAFAEQGGFEVIIAGDERGTYPGLMEGAYGQGRLLLSAMAFDKDIDPPAGRTKEGDAALAAFRDVFFRNLAAHVVNIRERRAPALNPTPGTWVPPFTPGAWTLAILPDTQIYSLRFPGLFSAQTAWVVANRERRSIAYAIQLGDITNNNTVREWQNAADSITPLMGVVPFALVTGNHDYGPSGDASSRDTLLNEYIPFRPHAAQATFGGAMTDGKLENTFHLFEAGGRKWIIVCLEWGPRADAIAWACKVMDEHPDRTGILVTHAYMNNNDLRYDHTDRNHPQEYNPHDYRTPGPVHDGEELWNMLVRSRNFAITLNGHVLGDGTGYLASVNDRGNSVHQILSNYQMRELGGEAYLRLMEFQPDGKTVVVKTYSPVFDRYMTQPDQMFTFELNPPMPDRRK